MVSEQFEVTLKKAVGGDASSLNFLIKEIQDKVYNLAVRMLKNPHDAEDATQEIIIRVIQNLGSFQGRSRFSTWVYKIASNYLLTTQKRQAELLGITFEFINKHLEAGGKVPIDHTISEPDRELLAHEVKIHCTHSMLLCLDRNLRLAFILKIILNIDSKQGAEILGITPEAYRKRVSRGRKLVSEFVMGKCGHINKENPCRCKRRVEFALRKKVIDSGKLPYISQGIESDNKIIRTYANEVEKLDEVTTVYRSNPYYKSTGILSEKIKELIVSGEFSILVAP
ncbi:MAG: RNA polymerase sigma factor [Clostridia bacterium]|nr:RNA polymerase sigma factor [Clostridia bacterium]